MRFAITAAAFVLTAVLAVPALAVQEGGGEHRGGGERSGSEGSGGEHGGGGEHGASEGGEGGGEGEESGTQYGLGDTARQSRAGVDLEIRYDASAQEFVGTVHNTTAAAVTDVRVEVHLSNGVELGPTPRRDLAPGATATVQLDARSQSFQRWSVHVEIGQSEHVPALPAAGIGVLTLLLLTIRRWGPPARVAHAGCVR